MPSALIPFCSYGTDMEAVGRELANFSFPVCDAFQPTLHLGRVCYELQLNPKLKSKEGINGGLMLLIDKNTERSIELEDASPQTENIRKKIRFSQDQRRSSAEIYIPTLSPLLLSEPGEYRLASLKLMTGTKSFTNLPHDVTKCYDGDFEACKNSKLRKASLRECGCMPWALKNFTDKVDLKPDWNIFFNLSGNSLL